MSEDGPPPSDENDQQVQSDPTAGGSNARSDAGLFQTTWEYWNGRQPKRREEFINSVYEFYENLRQDFGKTSVDLKDEYSGLEKQYNKWRLRVIIGTGVVAVLNVLAANFVAIQITTGGWSLFFAVAAVATALFAAVGAAVLGVLVNLENFLNALQRALQRRKAREPFVDAIDEFSYQWVTRVQPFDDSPEACMNAIELYRRITEKDIQLREDYIEATREEAEKPQ